MRKTSLRNFRNFVYPALPVSFGGDTESCRSLLCPSLKLSWTPPLLKRCDYAAEKRCPALNMEEEGRRTTVGPILCLNMRRIRNRE